MAVEGLGVILEVVLAATGVPFRGVRLAAGTVFAGVNVKRMAGAVGVQPGEDGVPAVTPGVPIFSSVLTRPPGGVSSVPGIGGGGPGANRFPSMGEGG
jgi:hypothetical protein